MRAHTSKQRVHPCALVNHNALTLGVSGTQRGKRQPLADSASAKLESAAVKISLEVCVCVRKTVLNPGKVKLM